MELEVQIATPEKLPDVARAVESVFGEELTDWEVGRLQATLAPERVIYVPDGDEIVAGAGAYTLRTTVPGGAALPTAGVTLVGVKPSHRRRGLLRTMMRRQLHDIHERGEPIATLWASEGGIYGRFGYGIASVQAWVDIERARGRFSNDPGPRGRTRMVPLDTGIKTIAPVYERVQAKTPGMFERRTVWWEKRLLADPKEWRDGASPKYVAAWEEEDEVRAYVIYRVEQGWSPAGVTGAVRIQELIATDATALREMWRFVFGIDLVDRIKSLYGMLAADTPLLLMLEDPARLRASLSDALWLRVVDVKAALEGRTYASDGDLTIELSDELCPWNAGRWALEVRAGRASVEPTDRGPDISLDASSLGSAYLGTFSAVQLLRAGRLDEIAPGGVGRADRLFHSDRAPYCPEIF